MAGLSLMLAALARPPAWDFEVGPLVARPDGLHVEPRLDLGGRVGNFRVHAGLEDVREGLSLSAGAEVNQKFTASAANLDELFTKLEAQDGLADDVLNPIVHSMSNVSRTVFHLVGTNILDSHGFESVDGEVTLKSGIGVGTKAAFGWADAEGFHMLGAGGHIMTGLGVGLSIFVGIRSRHDGGLPDLKIIIAAPNVALKLKIRRARLRRDAMPSLEYPSVLDRAAHGHAPPEPLALASPRLRTRRSHRRVDL